MPRTAYIVEAVRTAAGRRNGRLAKWHPVDLGATVIDEIIRRTRMDPTLVEDVIFGCVSPIGSQGMNIARNVVLASKLPESVPGTTVDRQCGSSQQAIHFAAQAVMSGTQDIVIAGGVESMSVVPIGASIMDGVKAGRGFPNSPGIQRRYNTETTVFSQFEGAELLAKKYSVSRQEMDESAVRSHQRAAIATRDGKFRSEIVPIKGHDKNGNEVVHDTDEGIRAETNLQGLVGLKTLKPDGLITAGTSSQIADGAAAVLICNEEGLKKLGLRPRAKIFAMALAGSNPEIMLEGPIPATQSVLKRAGLRIPDIDIYEVNEAFASVPLAWSKAIGADLNKLNVNGGAMALGHPLGATGCKLMTTLLYELERRNGRFGLLAICEGGGTANATIIERVQANSKL